MFKLLRSLLLLVFSLCSLGNAFAQVSISASIDSSSMMMGQQTVVHFQVSQPQDLALQLPMLTDALAPNVYIVSVSGDTVADGSTISINDNIVITVFEPGDYVIPPFVCRDQKTEYKTAELSLKVRDVPLIFEESRIPCEVKDIYNPPYSKALWVALIVASVLLVLFSVAAVFYWRKHRNDPEPYDRNNAVADSDKPEQTALELIRKMEADAIWKDDGNEKKFFTDLTDILRQYFFRRYDVNALEMTSSELLDALKKTDLPLSLRADVKFICFTGDMTKFAKYKPSSEECLQCVKQAENIVLSTMTVNASDADADSSDKATGDK